MLTWSPSRWNAVLAGVLLVGSVFIQRTRVLPTSGRTAPLSTATIAPDPAPQPNHLAPDFSLPAPDGTPIQLSDLKGKVVLINIWATWCPPCRAEMPMIQATYEQYRNQGFEVLAVNLQEQPRTVAAFMQQFGLTFATPLDVNGQVSAAYQATALPSSFFIDKQGVVRAVYRGPMQRSVIAGTVEQLLVEEQ